MKTLFPPRFRLQLLTKIIDNSIYTIAKETNEDILNDFYSEFTKYSGSNQTLGIVLTPKHIAKFMSNLLNITENDILLDTCCGSTSLLLSSKTKPKKLLGVEYNARMLSLGVANMIIGKRNALLINGDSFDIKVIEKLKKEKPTKMIINPPYSQPNYPELEFIKKGLSCLEQDGLGVAIVPMSCAIKQDSLSKKLRKEILENNTLLATFSMPDNLFYPVGVVSIIMLFKAGRPHSNKDKTFFAYLKDDGFELHKTLGRTDLNNRWNDIKKKTSV
ncbi:MAG: SAM-dependent DNA methyltransferase, partial [Clostridia bacterium]|nr:SAM-dependent DNA methyltransferase [Clostridia bacterium]